MEGGSGMSVDNTVFNLGISNSLDLFKLPIEQIGVDQTFYVEHKPITPLSNENAPMTFYIGESGNFMDLRKCRLRLKVKLVRADSTPLDEKEQVSLVNAPLHAGFSQVSCKIQGISVSNNDNLHPYRGYLKTLLNTSKEAKESHLTAELFKIDTGAFSTDLTSSLGMLFRGARLAKSQSCQIEGYLQDDIFSCDRLLLSNINMELKFYRARPEFYIQASTDHKYKLVIEDATFLACMVNLSPEVSFGISEGLQHSKALYPFTRTQILAFSIPTGARSFDFTNLFGNNLPSKLFCFFVKSSSLIGDFKTNPLYFEAAGLRDMYLSVDGIPMPAGGMRVEDFTSTGSMNSIPYMYLFDAITDGNLHSFGNGLDCELFSTGFSIYAFTTSAISRNRKHGNIWISGSFSTPLPEAMSLLIYGEYPAVLSIDASRNVYLE